MRRRRGFTLVEMLVAVALLGVLGSLAWRGFDRLLTQRARIVAQADDVERIVRVFGQLSRDVESRVPDVALGGSDRPPARLPAALDLSLDARGSPRLRILRERADGSPAWIAYGLEDETFERQTLPAAGGVAERVRLLAAVRRVDVRVLLPDGWRDVRGFLEAGVATGRVAAIELSVERAAGERYVRVLAL